MTRNIRKVVSIVCAVALLLSLCAVSLTGVGQAFKATDTPVGGALKLTFDGNKGVSDTSTKDSCGYLPISPTQYSASRLIQSTHLTLRLERTLTSARITARMRLLCSPIRSML